MSGMALREGAGWPLVRPRDLLLSLAFNPGRGVLMTGKGIQNVNRTR